jgi:hypothetical protein
MLKGIATDAIVVAAGFQRAPARHYRLAVDKLSAE